jgi:predicted SnoaL-like aldol condensation-catalyzing enzyme
MSSPRLTENNREIVEEFARLFYGEQRVREAFESFVSEDYVHHNPGFADGRAAAISGLTVLFGTSEATFDVQRTMVDSANDHPMF